MGKTSKKQLAMNKDWNARHQEEVRYNRYRNSAESFIRPKSKLQSETMENDPRYYDDLRDLQTLLKQRLEELK